MQLSGLCVTGVALRWIVIAMVRIISYCVMWSVMWAVWNWWCLGHAHQQWETDRERERERNGKLPSWLWRSSGRSLDAEWETTCFLETLRSVRDERRRGEQGLILCNVFKFNRMTRKQVLRRRPPPCGIMNLAAQSTYCCCHVVMISL